MKEADLLAYMRNINTRPGLNAGRSIDPTKPGPDADRIAPSPEPQDVLGAPEKLWLQWDGNGYGDNTWCADKINEDDVAYIRADCAALAQSDAQPLALQSYLPQLHDLALEKYKSAVEIYSEDHKTALLTVIDEVLFALDKIYTAPHRPDAPDAQPVGWEFIYGWRYTILDERAEWCHED